MAKTKPTKTEALALAPKATAIAAPMEDWEVELARKAKEETANEASGVARLIHSAAGFESDGNKLGTKIVVGIIDYGFSKAYYPEAYNPKKKQSPTCFAFATSAQGERGMTPHEVAPDKQCETCAACPHNMFGTAEKGNGKRCKDERRVMVIANTGDDEISGAEVRQLSIPPGSLKNWGAYLNGIADLTATGNVRCVLTEAGVEPRAGGAYSLTFRGAGKLGKEAVMAILARQAGVQGQMLAPFPVMKEEEAPAPAKASRAKKIS